MLGLYLHVPFCLRKCAYCSFYSTAGRQDYHRYLAAVRQQLALFARSPSNQPLSSIFFGGGTPTMLPPAALCSLLSQCCQHFPCSAAAEISLEANPATVTQPALDALRQAGFNRISIGIQSLQDDELQCLGRPHSAADAVETVRRARAAGFSNISIDLMYGLPQQTLSSWQETLAHAMHLAPQHISIYELTIEDGTPFARQQEQGQLAVPDEDSILRMLEHTQAMTAAAGFSRYEISNYALPGFACRHNLNYWQGGEWLGLGPSAVSSLDGSRYTAVADLASFCARIERGEDVWEDKETLSSEAAFRESVVIGLRLTAGVSLAALRCRFGLDALAYYGPTLTRLINLGMLEINADQLRLTAHGLLLANTVMAELV